MIEDDLAIRTLVTELLSEEGYEVQGAADGAAGLVQLDWLPDLILLDLMMPVMDGVTFLARRREIPERCDIPVIVMTARRDADIDVLDVAARVAKPFDADDLLAAVATVLNGSQNGAH